MARVNRILRHGWRRDSHTLPKFAHFPAVTYGWEHCRGANENRKSLGRKRWISLLRSICSLTVLNRNMRRRAALLAGDLDFRPLVEAVVQTGVFVELWYEKASTNENLHWAADQGRPIVWRNLYDWNSDAFRIAHPLPQVSGARNDYLTSPQIAYGTCAGRSVELLRLSANGPFVLHAALPDGNQSMKHAERQVLERYFKMMHGPINWTRSE
jgi:hypothetical protein